MKDDTTLIDEVLKKIPEKYQAVVISSKRARDINMGLAPMIKTDAEKPTTIALEEIAAGAYTPEMAIRGIEAVKGIKVVKRQLPSPPKDDDEEIDDAEDDEEEDDNG